MPQVWTDEYISRFYSTARTSRCIYCENLILLTVSIHFLVSKPENYHILHKPSRRHLADIPSLSAVEPRKTSWTRSRPLFSLQDCKLILRVTRPIAGYGLNIVFWVRTFLLNEHISNLIVTNCKNMEKSLVIPFFQLIRFFSPDLSPVMTEVEFNVLPSLTFSMSDIIVSLGSTFRPIESWRAVLHSRNSCLTRNLGSLGSIFHPSEGCGAVLHSQISCLTEC